MYLTAMKNEHRSRRQQHRDVLSQSLSTRKCGAFSWSISQEVKAFLQGFGSRVGMTRECLGVIRELWDSAAPSLSVLVQWIF